MKDRTVREGRGSKGAPVFGLVLPIAFRNVMRHKKRTIITIVTMVFGVASYIFVDGMFRGMDRLTIDNMTDLTTSYIKVRTPEYVDDELALPLEYGIPDPAGTIGKVEGADPGIVAVAPRVKFVAMVSNGVDSLPVVAIAVDPERDRKVFATGDFVEGSWVSDGTEAFVPSIVIGSGIADDLGLVLGDSVFLEARSTDDATNAAEFEVSGILTTPDPALNGQSVYLGLGAANELVRLEGFVGEICVKLPRGTSLSSDIEYAGRVAASIERALPGLSATPIKVLAGDYLAMRDMKGKGSLVVIFIIMLISAVGIVNTLLMSLYSRIKEVGVLRAYGLTSRDVKRVFFAEGVLIGLAGSVAGLLVGLPINAFMVDVGIPIGALVGKIDMGGIPLGGTLRSEWSAETIVTGFVFGLAVAVVASLIPARKAAKLKPVDALKFV